MKLLDLDFRDGSMLDKSGNVTLTNTNVVELNRLEKGMAANPTALNSYLTTSSPIVISNGSCNAFETDHKASTALLRAIFLILRYQVPNNYTL